MLFFKLKFLPGIYFQMKFGWFSANKSYFRIFFYFSSPFFVWNMSYFSLPYNKWWFSFLFRGWWSGGCGAHIIWRRLGRSPPRRDTGYSWRTDRAFWRLLPQRCVFKRDSNTKQSVITILFILFLTVFYFSRSLREIKGCRRLNSKKYWSGPF